MRFECCPGVLSFTVPGPEFDTYDFHANGNQKIGFGLDWIWPWKWHQHVIMPHHILTLVDVSSGHATENCLTFAGQSRGSLPTTVHSTPTEKCAQTHTEELNAPFTSFERLHITNHEAFEKKSKHPQQTGQHFLQYFNALFFLINQSKLHCFVEFT